MGMIFLSYSSKDDAVMEEVKKDLTKIGLSVWTDEGIRPGTPDWQSAIEQAILDCKVMVVLLSPDARKSRWVRAEISEAEIQERLIIPLFIRGNPKDSIPLSLRNAQFIDMSRDFTSGMGKLVKELKRREWIDTSEMPEESREEREKAGADSKAKEIYKKGRRVKDEAWLKVEADLMYKVVQSLLRYPFKTVHEMEKKRPVQELSQIIDQPVSTFLLPLNNRLEEIEEEFIMDTEEEEMIFEGIHERAYIAPFDFTQELINSLRKETDAGGNSRVSSVKGRNMKKVLVLEIFYREGEDLRSELQEALSVSSSTINNLRREGIQELVTRLLAK